MNSIVCLETIAVFVLGFCLICESTLTTGQNDTSVVLGGTVKLECFTTDKNYPPAWSYLKVGSDDKKDISLVLKQGDRIVSRLVNGYVERHSIVEDRNTGEYSLLITDAKLEDAGIYTCAARGGLGEKRSAELSVFESSTLTIVPNDASVVLGGAAKLECFTEDKTYPPAWFYQKVGSGEKKEISLVFRQGDLIVQRLVNGYVERHSIVEDRSTGEYSLQITDAKPEDAGTYTCAARGGLGERRWAELSVFEPFPVCASNITDVVGENDCHKEPDFIELSCKFLVYGKYLRKITWTVANHPEKAIKIDTPTTDDTGMVSSKLSIKGDYDGLDMTSFRCMVASTDNADDTRFACLTPKINVLKISNLTESKILEAPEEVECTGWSKLNASGCEWLRRDYDDSGHQHETYVTSKSLLNLYRQDMKPGTYICVANSNIHGEMCRVELLYVSYRPPRSEPVQQSGNVILASVLVVVALVVVAIVLIFICFRKRNKNRHSKPKTDLPMSSDSSLQNQHGATLLQSKRSSAELRNGVSLMVNVSDAKFGGPTDKPLEESDSGKGDSSPPSQQNTPPISQETPNHSTYDVPDAKMGGLTKAERTRLLEERAEARMRANELQKGVSVDIPD